MATLIHPALGPEEFAAAMSRAGWRAPMELIDGEVVVIPPSGGDAARAQTEIIHRLRAWQTATGRGGRVLADVFVRVGEGFLAPDVAWWSEGHEPVISPGAIDSVPDLVIEVLSPATRENDLGPKRAAYLASGVQELWLLDPTSQEVLRIDVDGQARLTAVDTLQSPLLPDLALLVAHLFD